MLKILENDVIERQDVTIHVPPALARPHPRGIVIPTFVETLTYTERGRELRSIRGGAVSALWYGQAIMQAFGSGSAGNSPNIDYLSDSIKAMICTSTYSADQDNHVFKSDVTNEIGNTGTYAAGGSALTTKTLTYTGSTNVIAFSADAVSYTSTSIAACRFCVIYDATPSTDATRPLLWVINFGSDVSTTNGTLSITPAAGGYATITPS